jgi:hypothetical protein
LVKVALDEYISGSFLKADFIKKMQMRVDKHLSPEKKGQRRGCGGA